MNSLKDLIIIGKNNGATGAGKEYLLKNLEQFFELLKQDLLLAEQYVDFFNTTDVEALMSYCHSENENFFEKMFKLSEKSEKFSLLTSPIVAITADNVHQYLDEMFWTNIRAKRQTDSKNNNIYDNYYKDLLLFKSSGARFHYYAEGSYQHNLKNCELAYSQYKHPQHIALVMQRIICAMINKVKTPALFDRELLKIPYALLFTLLELNKYKEIQLILSMVHDNVLRMELLKAKKPGESIFINKLIKAEPASSQTLALIYERIKKMPEWHLNIFFNYVPGQLVQDIKNKSIPFATQTLNKDFQIKSLSELIVLGKGSGAIGAGVQYLLENPEQFLSLIKEDINLAHEYAKLLSSDEVTRIVLATHAKGSKFFTEILNLTQSPAKINPTDKKIEITQDNVEDHVLQIKDKIKRYASMEHEEHGNYYYGFKYLFRMSAWYSINPNDNSLELDKYSFMDINTDNCVYAYKQLKENMDIIRYILSILLQKMNGSLDYEFSEESNVLTRLWNGNAPHLLAMLHNEKNYGDLEKAMNLISSAVLFPQLEKLAAADKRFLMIHLQAITNRIKGADNNTIEKFLNKVCLFSMLLQLRRYDALILCITSISATVLYTQLLTHSVEGGMFISKLVQSLPETEQTLSTAIMQLKQLDVNDLDKFFKQLPIVFLANLKEKSLPLAQAFYALNLVLAKQHFQLTDEDLKDLVPGFDAPLPYNPSALVSYRGLINQLAATTSTMGVPGYTLKQ